MERYLARSGQSASGGSGPDRDAPETDDHGEDADAETKETAPGGDGSASGAVRETTRAQIERTEARIERALADNGGRLNQRDIPAAADLSQSTVSRRLIAMEQQGAVTRYEIGRRKIVFLPGAEPEAFESPTDESDADPRSVT